MPKSPKCYFKAAKHVEHRVAVQTFHFFDETDRESIEMAYRLAVDSAAAMSGVVSVWRMPRERGAWSRGTVNPGVPVIGESRQTPRGAATGDDGINDIAAAGLRRAGLN
jgi:hypothetical protein